MSQKFFYNNKHKYSRTFGRNGKRFIVERDYSGHDGIMCDSCKKEIFGEAPYTISVTEEGIVRTLNREKHIEPLSNENQKMVFAQIVCAGGRQQSHFCNSCVGRMEDHYQRFKAKT